MKVLYLIFITLNIIGVLHDLQAQPAAVIDLRYTDVCESSQPLNGACVWYANRLLSPQETRHAAGEPITFPSLFDTPNSIFDFGYGTYKLTVLLPEDIRAYGLSLPQVYSSYKFWANDSLIAVNGMTGKSKSEYRPQWLPQTVRFQVTSDTLTLVMQIANFDHAKGGISSSIFLGEASQMQFEERTTDISKLIEASALVLIGLPFFILFFYYRKNVALWFAIMCFSWGMRRLISDTYLFISWFPDFNWSLAVHIEYLLFYSFLLSAAQFTGNAFRHEADAVMQRIFVFANVLFIVFTLVAPPHYFTYGIDVYIVTAVVLLVYVVITAGRAWFNERPGSNWLALSVLFAVNVTGYDIFVFEGFSSSPYNALFFCIGYVSTFLLISIFLVVHLKSEETEMVMPHSTGREEYLVGHNRHHKY